MLWRITGLSSAAFRGSYQSMKELLNVSDTSIEVSKVASEIYDATSKISHATRKAI